MATRERRLEVRGRAILVRVTIADLTANGDWLLLLSSAETLSR
ncbi:MAG: hypothetical protein AABZ53_16530 [Planctomycetota bacterium]